MQNHTIDICIATFQRESLRACLLSLGELQIPESSDVRIIIADNDETPSAKLLVDTMREKISLELNYNHAPSRNISIARNACLAASTADWIAFIDDDETAQADWLVKLFDYAHGHELDAVFGPALAVYPQTAPQWMQQLRPHDNIPQRRSGVVETGHTCNALVKRSAIASQKFDTDLGTTGGEDTAFFYQAFHAGAKYGICEQAVVHEIVSENRLSLEWLMQRQRRAGQTYARSASAKPWRVVLPAVAKMSVSRLMQLTATNEIKRQYWKLRGALHAGAVSTLFGEKQQQLYGK